MTSEPTPAPKSAAKATKPAPATLLSVVVAALSIRHTDNGPILSVTFTGPGGTGEVAIFPETLAALGGRAFVASLVGSTIAVEQQGTVTTSAGRTFPRYRFAGLATLNDSALAALGL